MSVAFMSHALARRLSSKAAAAFSDCSDKVSSVFLEISCELFDLKILLICFVNSESSREQNFISGHDVQKNNLTDLHKRSHKAEYS